jgi:hypothetical protein
MFGIFWVATGAVIDRNARFGTRDMVLRRVREQAERQQSLAVPITPDGLPWLEFRSYTRTTRYWNRTLLRVVVGNGLIALLALLNPRAPLLLFITGPTLLWTLIARFDRRPYLDFSREGIWCRAWGKGRFPFHDFKAAYPRQDRLGEQGVVLVPRDSKALIPKPSWQSLVLLSGTQMPAHAGTMTIWTSQVGLDRDSILRGIQAELSTMGHTDGHRI